MPPGISGPESRQIVLSGIGSEFVRQLADGVADGIAQSLDDSGSNCFP